LLPLPDRCDRMMLRNLKALKSLRQPAAPSVSIGAAGQVNVATQQANVAIAGEASASSAAATRSLSSYRRSFGRHISCDPVSADQPSLSHPVMV
jgi:hypothetical protein